MSSIQTTEPSASPNWAALCSSADLPEGLGVRALVDGMQIALFRVAGKLYAIDAMDPFSGAAVLSRGIVGDLKGHVVVASPLYKQHFDLDTGECLEDASVKVRAFAVRESAEQIEVAL